MEGLSTCWSQYLNLSWHRPISYRNQSINLWSKSMVWFLYDIGLRHESVKIQKTFNSSSTFHKRKATRKNLRNVIGQKQPPEVLCEKRCSQKLPRPKACNFNKKETLAYVFSCEFYEIQEHVFHRPPPDDWFWLGTFVP